MAAYESWQDVMDDACERLSGSLQQTFKALTTNNDRILFCMRETLATDAIDEWLKILCSARHRKHWEKAYELRHEGNLCFSAEKYVEAAEFYTRSILCAPFPDESTQQEHQEELSMSFANRSASWFYLSKYSLALRDIEQALSHSYPSGLRHKLLLRQAQCFLKKGKPESAIKSLRDAEGALKSAELDEQKAEKQQREIELLRNKCTSSIPVERSEESDDDLEDEEIVQPSPHQTIPNASSALDSLYSTEKGRFIVANKEIKAGDNLFVERPYASVLLPTFYKTHCHHCYRRIKAAHPCRQCSHVRYCTAACAADSWRQYHSHECGYLNLLSSVGIAHLAERVILMTGLTLIEDFMRSRNTLDCSYLPIYQLVTHESEMHVEDLLQYSLTATLLLRFLERHTSFFTYSNQFSERIQDLQLRSVRPQPRPQMRSECGVELKLFVGALILRHIQQLICNAHAISTIQQPGEVIEEDDLIIEQEQVRVASALFASASLMNHSCDPNIISSFRSGSTLVVKAVRKINEGEEVLNCYGPHFRRMPFQERQTSLKEQYFFDCTCRACQEGEKEDLILMALKCDYCEGPVGQVASSGRADCFQCSTTQECLEKEQRAFRMHDLFVQGVQLADIGNYGDALEKLQRCLSTREKLLYRHNKQLMETRDMVAKCLCALGNFRDAASILKLAVDSVCHIYGKNSIEFGNELLKFGDVLMNATQESFAKTGYSRELGTFIGDTKRVILLSEPIYLLHYGKSHPAIAELTDKKKKLETFIARYDGESSGKKSE